MRSSSQKALAIRPETVPPIDQLVQATPPQQSTAHSLGSLPATLPNARPPPQQLAECLADQSGDVPTSAHEPPNRHT